MPQHNASSQTTSILRSATTIPSIITDVSNLRQVVGQVSLSAYSVILQTFFKIRNTSANMHRDAYVSFDKSRHDSQLCAKTKKSQHVQSSNWNMPNNQLFSERSPRGCISANTVSINNLSEPTSSLQKTTTMFLNSRKEVQDTISNQIVN